MGKITWIPTNGVVEPDFLDYLARTFDRWGKLPAEKVTLGTREVAKFEDVLMGAKLNARFGFEVETRRETSGEDGLEHYTVTIYKKCLTIEKQLGKEKEEKPLYSFDTIIYR